MIYLDNNATTPMLAEVRAALLPFLEQAYGNPNSPHQQGNQARVAIEKARSQVAKALGVLPSEITFTGCGSEANNHAIVGSLLARRERRKNLVISAIEHPSVEMTARWAAGQFGFELRIAPFRISEGKIDPQPFFDCIDEDTVLVSVMAANNESGVQLPLREIFQAAKAVGSLCHADGIQGFGKWRLLPGELGIDLLSISAHKIHGPKGVGALYIRRGVHIESLIHGGSQENNRRAGTENVAHIVGLGVAAHHTAEFDNQSIASVRDYFESELTRQLGDRVTINFQALNRTPNVSSVCFKKEDANLLLIKLDRKGICVSTGSACSSGSLSASKGLMAAGLTEAQAQSTLRFSFSRFNTRAEVDQTTTALVEILGTKRRGRR